ncbi:MAG: hypothetical protein WA156_03320 [Methylocystis silviterrae]
MPTEKTKDFRLVAFLQQPVRPFALPIRPSAVWLGVKRILRAVGLEARTAALRSMACRLGEICRRQHGHNAGMLAGRLFRASAAAKIASASAFDMREMVSSERVLTARKKSCDMSRYYMGIGRSFGQ